MSEPRLISPLLDGFAIGGPISDHHGVSCYPAMKNESDDKYIVKVISIPASQTQLDALLLTGVYADAASAMSYFKELSDDVLKEVDVLNRLSQVEGFLSFDGCQAEEKTEEAGYDIYLLSKYKRTLEKHFRKSPLTHLGALNLGLDLCAALTASRRCGYLYAALKPGNVFVTAEQEFRIGDLGFLRLDSLKYTSLPEKCRSAYTPPEISDAYSTLNTTIDTYAVGLILYQAYNNGELPVSDTPEEPFAAPAYADYEMAEIILKACDPDPEKRWEDPAQLGQALVNYMQRNGANDTPIVPPAPVIEEDPILSEEALPLEEEMPVVPEIESDDMTDSSAEAAEADTEMQQPAVDSDEDFENLSFLPDEDEIDPEEADISYEEVSSEVTEILEQADELASHPVPDPAVAPEPIEVVLPEPEPEETAEAEEEISQEETDTPESGEEEAESPENTEEVSEDGEEEESPKVRKSKKRWIWAGVITALVLGLLVAGFFFIKDYYLVQIKDITLSGSEDTLTVQVDTDIDESILTVVCTDSHGNQFSAPVKDGKAVITGLIPDTGYNVKVMVIGFHRITGESSTAYSTPAQTNIIQFNALMGSEEGSVILGFNIDGPDSDQWSIRYFCEGMEPVTVSFPSHMFTLTGLTLDKEYTFQLMPASKLFMTGTDEIKFTPTKLIYAEDLRVDGWIDNALQVSWKTPANTEVSSWTVRCYNESGSYNETVVAEQPTVSFTKLKQDDNYTIEVTAANMSVGQRAYVEKNAITLSNLKVDDTKPNQLTLSWDATQTSTEGWLLSYTADGSGSTVVPCPGNSAVISPVVPGAKYTFTITDAKGTQVLGGIIDHTAKAASEFSGYSVSASNMKFSMCRTPNYKNWNRYYLSSSDYTTQFKIGEKASFLVKLNKSYKSSSDNIVTLFAIYGADGKLLSTATQSQSWSKMWSSGYCELDIPSLPDKAGKYSIRVYFNGALAAKQDFTVQ